VRKPLVGSLLAMLMVLAGFMAIAASAALPKHGRSASPYLLVATAKLDRKRFIANHHKSGATYIYGDCARLARSKVDCKYQELQTVDGVRESTTVTIHVRSAYTAKGTIRYISETLVGPVEA
jgi:hypothetical protein